MPTARLRANSVATPVDLNDGASTLTVFTAGTSSGFAGNSSDYFNEVDTADNTNYVYTAYSMVNGDNITYDIGFVDVPADFASMTEVRLRMSTRISNWVDDPHSWQFRIWNATLDTIYVDHATRTSATAQNQSWDLTTGGGTLSLTAAGSSASAADWSGCRLRLDHSDDGNTMASDNVNVVEIRWVQVDITYTAITNSAPSPLIIPRNQAVHRASRW